MHTRVLHRATTLTLLAALAITLPLIAQDSPDHKSKHHQYKQYDLGTFGGPSSGTSLGVCREYVSTSLALRLEIH
jgi:hypothetical protein